MMSSSMMMKDIEILLPGPRAIHKARIAARHLGYHVAFKVADFIHIRLSFDMDEEGRLACSLQGKAK
jgi:hypothetical protein